MVEGRIESDWCFMLIPLSQIDVDPTWNIRTEVIVVDLADSIKVDGLLNPLTVSKHGGRYRLIAGFRRFEAVRELQWSAVECSIVEADEEQARRLNVMENLSRHDLNPLEEARAMKLMFPDPKTRIADICMALVMSPSWVSRRKYLLKMPPEVQARFASRELPISKIYSLFKATDPKAAAKIILNRTESRRNYIPVHNQKRKTMKEMRHMIIKLMEARLQGLATRVLAWASGNITDADIEKDIRELRA